MNLKRYFLGWTEPFLHSSARFLRDLRRAGGRIDLSDATVLVPSARAGRRLLEILAVQAESEDAVLFPPRIATLSSLYTALGIYRAKAADEIERALFWMKALASAERTMLERLLPKPPKEDETLKWFTLAERFDALAAELGAYGLTFADVAGRGETLASFDEADRWNALAAIRQSYLVLLTSSGLEDPVASALAASSVAATLAFPGTLVLAGLSDIPPLAEKLLEKTSGEIISLVFAPKEDASAFDPFGRLLTEKWLGREAIAPDAAQVFVAYDAPDAGARAFQALGAARRAYAADELTVAVCDPDLSPFVARAFASKGVNTRDAAGIPLSQTPPALVLAALQRYLDSGLVFDLATLARLTPVEAWLMKRLDKSAAAALGGSPAAFFDRFHSEHLPSLVGPAAEISAGGGTLRAIADEVEVILGELRGARRTIAGWAEPLNQTLLSIFGNRELSRAAPSERLLIDACELIHEKLLGWRDAAHEGAPSLSGSDALALLIRQLGGEALPRDQEEQAVEIVGWLELSLDDAPAAVIAGMNEGFVPESLNSDPFLPNALRRALGILDNDRRLARDTHAFSSMLASKEDLWVVASRKNADGEPLLLSRLLLGGEPREIASRVLDFYEASKVPRPAPGAGKKEELFKLPIEPAAAQKLFDSISVSGLKDYLDCPYRFYLKHVLGIRIREDTAAEMDAALFGTLAHEALRDFADSAERHSEDADAVCGALRRTLAAASKRRFGARPLPAVVVQIEQLARRLENIGRWQAGWAARGWRIEHRELELPLAATTIDVDGKPIRLTCQIDRIDVNRKTGEWAILDYKTREDAKEPESTHRIKKTTWIDLQLPLYRHLVRRAWPERSPAVGYIALPQNADECGEYMARWSEEEYGSALEVMKEIVRKIRGGVFWPPAERLKFKTELDPLCGVDQFPAEEGEGEGDE